MLKTYLRRTLSEHRLNVLALLHINLEIDLDMHKVIDRFAFRHPCRMKLINILDSDPCD